MKHFLDKKLKGYFKIKAYLLDPSKFKEDSINSFIKLDNPFALDIEPFDGLFKIDFIEAQRGFSDSSSNNIDQIRKGNLSQQLRNYYYNHLDPFKTPDKDDLDALHALEKARSTFDDKLNSSFSNAINEISKIGYPGFTDPKIMSTPTEK